MNTQKQLLLAENLINQKRKEFLKSNPKDPIIEWFNLDSQILDKYRLFVNLLFLYPVNPKKYKTFKRLNKHQKISFIFDHLIACYFKILEENCEKHWIKTSVIYKQFRFVFQNYSKKIIDQYPKIYKDIHFVNARKTSASLLDSIFSCLKLNKVCNLDDNYFNLRLKYTNNTLKNLHILYVHAIQQCKTHKQLLDEKAVKEFKIEEQLKNELWLQQAQQQEKQEDIVEKIKKLQNKTITPPSDLKGYSSLGDIDDILQAMMALSESDKYKLKDKIHEIKGDKKPKPKKDFNFKRNLEIE